MDEFFYLYLYIPFDIFMKKLFFTHFHVDMDMCLFLYIWYLNYCLLDCTFLQEYIAGHFI